MCYLRGTSVVVHSFVFARICAHLRALAWPIPSYLRGLAIRISSKFVMALALELVLAPALALQSAVLSVNVPVALANCAMANQVSCIRF